MTNHISRRDLLKRSALAAGALSLSRDSLAYVTRAAPKKVVIIGAGLAGLSAAHELVQAGHEVTILEARARPGGRVLTLREPFSDGLYAEAGALFIPSNHSYTMRYVRRFDLPLVPILGRGSAELFYVRGRRIIFRHGAEIDWPLNLTREEQALGLDGMWDKYLKPVVDQIRDASSSDWPPDSLRKYDRITAVELLRNQGASDDAISLLRLGYFDLWGDGADNISALSLLRDLWLRKDERETYAIRGGNDLLPKALASRLKENIRYGAPVTKIERRSETVRLSYRQEGESRNISAERVVCAIPFSVLRRIPVEPVWSPEKQKAIEQLPYTSVARVYLQSRTRFWKGQGIPGAANTDLPIMWLWEPTVKQEGPRGILESYMAGAQARKVTAMKEGDRISFTLEHMEKVYPGMRENFERGATKCWDEDEWSRGDYAWFKPGQMTSLLPHIARREGRIHFAGEHASAWPGWMQGALESGNRAAREIIESD